MGAPRYAVEAIVAARRRAITALGARVEIRVADDGQCSMHATEPMLEGEVIFRERPVAMAPSLAFSEHYGEGGAAGLATCEQCMAPVGSVAVQLRCLAEAAGMTPAEVAGLPSTLPVGESASDGTIRCDGCAAVWCSAVCERCSEGWHPRLCAGRLRQRGRPRAAEAATAYRDAAVASGNAAFLVASRLYASLPLPEPGTGPQSETAPQCQGMGEVVLSWEALRGFCGANWWDTLQPTDPAASIDSEAGGGWGAAYGTAFREEMVAQTARLAALLRRTLTEDEPEPEVEPLEAEDIDEDSGWLSTAGLGWVVGVLRLNSQAMLVESPLPDG